MVMEVNPEHPPKQPRLVTELGMVMEVKPEHPPKQDAPRLVTELGMVMEVKPEQRAYLLLVDYQYYTL